MWYWRWLWSWLKSKYMKVVSVLALLLSLIGIGDPGDPDDFGAIAGTVTDAVTGDGIDGATILLEGEVAMTTGADGTYMMTDVPPGTYQVAADADGYEAADAVSVDVGTAEIVQDVDFALELETDDPDPVDPEDFTAFVEQGTLEIGEELFELPACPDGQQADPADEGCVYFHGFDLGNGTHEIPPEGVNFPVLIDEVDTPLGLEDLVVQFAAPDGASGTLDRDTGELSVDMDLEINIQIGDLTDDDCRLPGVSIAATTGESGGLSGSPLDAEGRATIVDGLFEVPGAVGCGSYLGFINMNTQVNNELNLPSPSGNNDLVFDVLLVDGHVEPGEPGDPVEPEDGSIAGTVTGDGAPLEGATVSGDGLSATTGADGSYSIADVEPGTYELTADADGFESETATVEVGDGQDVTQDFDLTAEIVEPETGSVSGLVTGDGEPLEGATVSGDGLSATTDADGIYTIDDVDAGSYDLVASADGFVDSDAQTVEVAEGEDVTGVDFDLEPEFVAPTTGSIAGTVSGEGGALEGATVTAAGQSVTTGADGSYSLSDVEAGTYEVTAEADGFISATETGVEVVAEETTTVDFDLDVVPPEPGAIAGTVTGDGAPLEGATVTANGQSATTGADGSYTISDVEAGTYSVSASADGFVDSNAVSVEVDAGETSTVDFALEAEAEPLFQPGPFSMVVEAGGVVIGTSGEDPYIIDFTACPGGEPAEPGEQCISFDGEIDADGNLTIQPEDVNFPQVEEEEPFPLFVNTSVSDPITGNIDPETGEGSVSLPIQVDIDINQTGGSDCRIVLTVEGTTGSSGDVAGGPLTDDGRLSIVDGEFAVPDVEQLDGGFGFLCGAVGNEAGVPSPAGENTAEFDLLLIQ